MHDTYLQTKNHSVGLNRVLQVKLINSVIASIFLVAGIVYEMVFPQQQQVANIILAIAALAVGTPVFINAVKGLLNREGKYVTEQLVGLAILASMVGGDFIVATIIPIILVFGHLLEEKSIMGIEEAIASLKQLHSRKARILKDGEEDLIDPEELKIGDKIAVYPGDTIPADGVIIDGETLINQAPITGESVPVEAYSGVNVYAGTVNINGKVVIKVSCLSEQTVFNKIISLLEKAEKSKAPIVKIVERYLTLYFPFVIMVAAITLFLTSDINRAITILVISCPCALILASPTAMIAALVTTSRNGIMIKNTAFLETLAEVDTLIFDKTGTVTLGELELEEIHLLEDTSREEILKIASICANGSLHPICVSVRKYARKAKLETSVPESQTELHGKGVVAIHNDTTYYLGRKSWIAEEIKLTDSEEDNSFKGTSVWVANNQKLLGQITFSDQPRPEIKESIKACRKFGIKNVYLLTGDRQEIADHIGKSLGVDKIVAECLPQDKLDFVNSQKEAGFKVMFVGDGINDALALKASNVGVAVARGGSDIAIQNSDITLNSTSLDNLPLMFRLSERTREVINQNILIGTGFGLSMMIIASAGLISPVTGAITHNFGSIFVVLNSARMLKDK